jgi:3-hydroxyisobutyrate dehydrogenase-like beta-hydroxyacid dehydrogenase
MAVSERIGFIGVGAMGAPMAERLIASGHRVAVSDPNEKARKQLAALGAVEQFSAAKAAAGAETVFACLPSPEVSRCVADEVAEVSDVRTYVETSTIGTAAIKAIAGRMAARGIAVLDAPVSGGPRGARAGTLAMMVSGERAAFDRARSLFEAIAGRVFYVGAEPGLGQITKLANNMISAAGMAAACEAAVMAVKAGVDARTLIDTVNASTGRNTATTDKFPQSILPRTFDYGGKLSTMYKDVELCFEEAKSLGVPMGVGASVVQIWLQAMHQGRGDADYTTIIQMIEEAAGGVVVEAK